MAISRMDMEKDKWVKKLGTKFKKDIEKGLIKVGWSSKKHPSDLSGRSHYEESKFFFDWGFINVTCFDMADHMGVVDVLAIDIFDNEVDKWKHLVIVILILCIFQNWVN